MYCGVSLSSRLRKPALQRRIAVQLGGILPVLSDKLYGLGVPEQCPYMLLLLLWYTLAFPKTLFLTGHLCCRKLPLMKEYINLKFDIFDNPYGAPRPTESQNPPTTKKEIPKTPKAPIIPKSKCSFPQSKRSFPKRKR